MADLLGLVVRISAMYLYALLILRLSGKRSLHHLSPIDFVVTTAVGDMFDDIFWAEVPLAQGLVAITTFMLVHVLVAAGSWRSTALDRLANGTRTILVQDGAFQAAGLAHERVGPHTVCQALRQVGEDDLAVIEQASLEPDGRLSVLKRQPHRPLQRNDVPALREETA
jgi:uncharacterized membrane protein YcaP (DUF421 family)